MHKENDIGRAGHMDAHMPWFDADFHWIKKQSSTVLNHSGGYVLPAYGPSGFDPTTVLNHRLTRKFTFYPGDAIEGFLLGEGSAQVPANYLDRMMLPMQIVVWGRAKVSYGAWLKVGINRQKQPTPNKWSDWKRLRRLPLFSAHDEPVAGNENKFAEIGAKWDGVSGNLEVHVVKVVNVGCEVRRAWYLAVSIETDNAAWSLSHRPREKERSAASNSLRPPGPQTSGSCVRELIRKRSRVSKISALYGRRAVLQ
jgi:hypothetical protein